MRGKNVFAFSLVVAAFVLSTPATAQLPSPDDLGHCGGLGQRACCVFEAFPSCDLLIYETGQISGETCKYLGIFPFPAGVCGDAHPDALDYCGADGQRACCAGESPLDIPCDTGNIQNFSGLGGTCGEDATFPGAGAGTCALLSSPCGGHLERACVPFPVDLAASPCDVSLNGDVGLIEISGCVGPRCGPSTSWCYRPTSCGGEGQRSCCGPADVAGSAEFCDPGLERLPGVAGEATCGLGSADESAPFTGVSLAVCADPFAVQLATKDMQEPAVGWEGDEPSEEQDCSLPGFADLHAHLFAHLAFGGRVLAGAPFSREDGVRDALKQDTGVHGDHSFEAHPLGVHTQEGPPFCPGGSCGALSNFGAPLFTAWPTWRSTTHQQTYYKWLERAWRGGLRLLVQVAVADEALCESYPVDGVDCSDEMASIDAQIEAALDLEQFIDEENGGAGEGWFRIVTSPNEARLALSEGQLAVVLGIEAANLFNCRPLTESATAKTQMQCDGEQFFEEEVITHIEDRIEEYRSKGVRLVVPVQSSGNAFFAEDRLTFEGALLLRELFEAGMVVDVARLSGRGFDMASDVAGDMNRPVIASHVQISDLKLGLDERQRTLPQLQTIAASGGMVGVMLGDGARTYPSNQEPPTYTSKRVAIEDDCLYSSKTWLQKYRYTLDAMKAPVALGSDWNGIAGHVGPRFGHDACGLRPGERARQERLARRLQYPFELEGFGSFERQETGLRTFDFNFDGLAHVGLLPDFVADLRLLRTLDAPGGGTVGEQRAFVQERLVESQVDADLDQLYRSARAFVDVWERAEGGGSTEPPSGPGEPTGQPTGGGGFLQLLCEDRTVSADESCTASASIASDDMEDVDGLVQTPPGRYPLGSTVVTLSTDVVVCGAPPGSCVSTVTVVDTTKPSITCPQPVTVECEPRLPPPIFPDPDGPPAGQQPIQLPAGTPASHGVPTVTDSCGIKPRWTGCVSDYSAANNYPLGSTPVTCSASDGASPTPNVETCQFTVDVVDTRAPSITCPAPIVAECAGGDAALVTPRVATGSDVCSGVDITTHGAASFPRGTTDLTYEAVDSVGLEASCVAKVTVEDTKAPTIECPADVVAECTDASSAPVDLDVAEAADVCGDVSVSSNAGKRFPLGATTVTYVATDEVDLTSSCTMKVTVEDTTAPTIQCPADVVAECTGGSSAPVDPGVAQAADVCGDVSVSSSAGKRFPLGATTVTFVATDDVPLTASCTNKVTVRDTTPPPITSAAASPNALWPPDKKIRAVTLAVSSTDLCDSAAAVCEITGVRSNEPIVAWSPSLKSKDTWDWKKTAPLSLELRSWRIAKTSPRIYFIDLSCRDRAGNASTSTATAAVPLTQ